MSKDPYEVLGISPNATDDQVKAAYRAMARKYHPDNYADNPLSDLAQEKMQEINDAYDAIVRARKAGGTGTAGNTAGGGYNRAGGYAGGNTGAFADVRRMIQQNRIMDAEMLLDGVPASARSAEWHFLKGSVLYKKGWLEEAFRHFQTACQMEPSNPEYRQALNHIQMNRSTGGYRTAGQSTGGCDACDVCTALYCTDCCCECMGGDFIRCC